MCERGKDFGERGPRGEQVLVTDRSIQPSTPVEARIQLSVLTCVGLSTEIQPSTSKHGSRIAIGDSIGKAKLTSGKGAEAGDSTLVTCVWVLGYSCEGLGFGV